MELTCLLIADDLTGACDAAVQFTSPGRRVRVTLNSEASADVLAVSTESRDTGLGSFGKSLERLTHFRPRILFKKIDSTLRGNVGSEVAATMTAFDCRLAVVTPAFPAMGRLVEGGYLRTGDSDFVPRELAACFRGIAGGPIELRDAVSDAGLDAIVGEFIGQPERILWAGSAGMAAALGRYLGRGPAVVQRIPAGFALFCLGSDHPATSQQQERLIRLRNAALMAAEDATPESIRCALQKGPLVLRIRRGHTSAATLRRILPGAAAPLVLCGGDTAAMVCGALDVQAIELRQEVAPGIPCGELAGGPFHGFPVVTKSGGFGGADALIEVADFFTCSQPLH